MPRSAYAVRARHTGPRGRHAACQGVAGATKVRSMTDAPDSVAGMEPTPYDPSAVSHLLGALAYAQLSGFGELAAGAQLSPHLAAKGAIAGMAASVYRQFAAVSGRLTALGETPEAAMAPFVEAIDAFHARTAPSDWLEALIKAYVGHGIARDFYAELVNYVDGDTREFVLTLLEDSGQARFISETVREEIADDKRLGGRLALWARRIMGEALQQAQLVAGESDALTELLVGGEHGADLAEFGRIFGRIADAHTRRMERLGLSA